MKAEHALLAYIKEHGAIKAQYGKRFLNNLVQVTSRRESAWDALINTGIIYMSGKAQYDLTPTGIAMLGVWDRTYGNPAHLVARASG